MTLTQEQIDMNKRLVAALRNGKYVTEAAPTETK